MQKLDLLNNLKEIVKTTKSQEITSFLSKSDKQPNSSISLVGLLVDSKAGYDQAITLPEMRKVLDQFYANLYYNTKNYTGLIQATIGNYEHPSMYIQKHKPISDFYNYHSTLITSLNLVQNILFEDSDLKSQLEEENIKTSDQHGFLNLVVKSQEKLELADFEKVITSINNLIECVQDIYQIIHNKKIEKSSNILLLDSGSDINITIKLPPEIAQSISRILNQAWDMITNSKGHKLEKNRSNLNMALGMLDDIDKALEKELITKEQAEIWRRAITSNADELIKMNTMTKAAEIELKSQNMLKSLPPRKNPSLPEKTE